MSAHLEADFNASLDVIDSFIKKSSSLLAEQEKIADDIVSIQGATAEAVKNKAKAKDISSTQAKVATMQAQNDARKVLDARGGIDRQVELAKKARIAGDNAIKQIADVRKLEEVTVNDAGILGFIAAQFKVGFEKKEADTAVAEAQTINRVITNNTSGINAARDAAERTKETLTTASIAADSEVLAEQALIDAGKARLKAEIAKSTRIAQAIAFSKDEVNFTIRRYQLGREKENAEALASERKLRAAQIGRSTEVDDAKVAAYNAGRKLLELEPENRGTVLAKFSLKGEARDEANVLFNLGTRGSRSTPANTLRAHIFGNKKLLFNKSNPALTALKRSAAAIGEAAKAANKELTPEQFDNKVNKRTESDFEKFDKKITHGDKTNPNVALPISTLLETAVLSDNAFLQGIVKPRHDEDLSPEQLLALGARSIGEVDPVTKKKITIEEVVRGGTDLYAQAIIQNNTQQDRERLQLPIQQFYNAEVDVPGTLSFGEEVSKVNLIDPIEFKKALLRYKNALDNNPETELIDALF